MADLFTLTCPSCGGKLEITADIERFACGYCGQEHMVKHQGNVVTLAPVIGELKNIRHGVDLTASELAIVRLSQEIGDLENKLKQVRTKKKQAENQRVFSLIIVLSLAFLILAGLISSWTSNGLVAICGAGLPVCIYFVYSVLKPKKEEVVEKELQEKLQKKQADLKRHKQIVGT